MSDGQQTNGNAMQVYDSKDLAAVNAAEIDMQIATARKYPRDEGKAITKAVSLATRKVKIAQSCQYFRPVGKKDGKQNFASGPSIRLAEIMKITWGNLRIAKRVIGVRDGMVGVEWGVHDLESNMMDRGEVWRPYFGKDAMIPVITAAALKFAERDAVFAGIPKAQADEVWEECKKVIVGEGEQRESLKAAVEKSFAELGVTKEQLYSVIDRKEYPADSDEEILFLIGLNNAIKDQLCTVTEVFGEQLTPAQKGGKGKSTSDKPATQTPRQRFNVLKKALMHSTKMAKTGDYIKQYCDSVGAEQKDLSNEQLTALCDELEKL